MAQARVTNPSLFSLFLLLLVPFCSSRTGIISEKNGNTDRYIVVFDAGKLGTTAHVFRFDANSNLLKIDGEADTLFMIQTGLIEYVDEIDEIASLLAPLLQNAVNAVPANRCSETPIILGATDEMLFLGEEKCEEILQMVRNLFSKSPLLYDPKWIRVLPGAKQGSYLWATINYLLGNMGGDYSNTVSVLDQERASVETAYVVSKEAAKQDNNEVTKKEYITPHYFNGTEYYLYSHSYWPYGAYAVRGEILKYTNDSYTYCAVSGYNEQFDYFGTIYNVRTAPSGSSYEKCRENVLLALNLNATCRVKNCTFDGVWNGGGGAGVENLYVTSGFRNTGVDIGLVNRSNPVTELRLVDYEEVAKKVCAAKSFEEAHELFPNVPSDDLPYLCMDLVCLYSVLVDGLRVEPTKVLMAVDSLKYGDSYVEAFWPLGAALEFISSDDARTASIMDIPFSVSHPSIQIV